jgi:hypothetical protein
MGNLAEAIAEENVFDALDAERENDIAPKVPAERFPTSQGESESKRSG